jgi:hypothetical protein
LFPTGDTGEVPFELVALNFTYTVSPLDREKGDAYSTDKGTVHVLVEMIVEFVPSQLVVSSLNEVPSLCRK